MAEIHVERLIEDARKLVNPVVMTGDFDDDDDELTPTYPPPSKYAANKAVDMLADALASLSVSTDGLRAEILRLVDALEYAHSDGFEWPVDPLPFGSIAHNLFIERGNDPERIAAKHPQPPSGDKRS